MHPFKKMIFQTVNESSVGSLGISCYTLVMNYVTTPALCLGNPYDQVNSSVTFTLKDSEGNPAIADIDYEFEIEVREKSTGFAEVTTFEVATILQGNSSVEYGNFFNTYEDGGQGECSNIYREFVRLIRVKTGSTTVNIDNCEFM